MRYYKHNISDVLETIIKNFGHHFFPLYPCSVVVYVNETRKGMVEGTEPQGFGYTSFIPKSYY